MTSNKQSSVDKDFVPYEEALALKEVGFNEPCLKFHVAGKLILALDAENGDTNSKLNGYNPLYVSAPTFSQAFRWIREKHNLPSNLELLEAGWDYVTYSHNVEEEINYGDGPFQTYEEAELACIVKLIEIVKKVKK